MMRSRISATSDSTPFGFTRPSGENTYTEHEGIDKLSRDFVLAFLGTRPPLATSHWREAGITFPVQITTPAYLHEDSTSCDTNYSLPLSGAILPKRHK